MKTFSPTHTIALNDGAEIPVQLVDGVLYTREEWDDGTPADWELVDGELRFQGEVRHGASYRSI